MDNNNNFKEFLNNPFTLRFLEYYESVICQSASTFSAINDEAKSRNFKFKSDELREIMEYINKQNFELIRVLKLNEILHSLIEDSDYEIIDVKRFLNVFTDKCNSIIEKLCYFEASKETEMKIKVKKNIINYAMLEFIRSYALKYGENTNFKITYRCQNNNVIIQISAETSQTINDFPRKSEFNIFKNHFNEINEVISEKSGANYEYRKNLMIITIPQCKDDFVSVFMNRQLISNYQDYSIYSVMLQDIK